MIHTFKIHCIPPKSTHQAALRIMKKRDGTQFIGKFDSSNGKRVQEHLIALIAPHRPPQPLEGPVQVHIEWEYPWRKSEPKKNRLLGFKPCDKRPDVDNLVKAFLDILTRLNFWNDDGQVCDLRFIKSWGNNPGIFCWIQEIEIGRYVEGGKQAAQIGLPITGGMANAEEEEGSGEDGDTQGDETFVLSAQG